VTSTEVGEESAPAEVLADPSIGESIEVEPLREAQTDDFEDESTGRRQAEADEAPLGVV
jgi:hypothetical protein